MSLNCIYVNGFIVINPTLTCITQMIIWLCENACIYALGVQRVNALRQQWPTMFHNVFSSSKDFPCLSMHTARTLAMYVALKFSGDGHYQLHVLTYKDMAGTTPCKLFLMNINTLGGRREVGINWLYNVSKAMSHHMPYDNKCK